MTGGPVAALLDGARLHLQHGPIDLIVGADPFPDLERYGGGSRGAESGDSAAARRQAFAAAAERFASVLEGLVEELPRHRSALRPDTPEPGNPVARRMYRAGRQFCRDAFLTPMIAVAGSVADEILDAMLAAGPLRRAYVNNGGDIAIHLAPGATYAVAILGTGGETLGRVCLDAASGVRGIATSGASGRSLSLGIADSVTVLAGTAATADVAATLIANAVDLPGHAGIARRPAREVRPDSDLGNRLAVTSVPRLDASEIDQALDAGARLANSMIERGAIAGAALALQGRSAVARLPVECGRGTELELGPEFDFGSRLDPVGVLGKVASGDRCGRDREISGFSSGMVAQSAADIGIGAGLETCCIGGGANAVDRARAEREVENA